MRLCSRCACGVQLDPYISFKWDFLGIPETDGERRHAERWALMEACEDMFEESDIERDEPWRI